MANTPISPKVSAGANAAAYATLVLTLLDSLAPDSFAFLGKLQPLAYGVVIGGSYALRAWLKADPLRDAGAAAQKAAADQLDAIGKKVADLRIQFPAPASTDAAPVSTFPKAAVDAAVAASEPALAEPAPVAPVFETPVPVAEAPVA
ncbi:hypothetical protein [Arthrobacter sp. efr-133-TYG-118]|uniref:hypothetical protein n=1 Tax=Arthrobacter sp. efr-133-TYG-118 TaxID=3040279 RepID=UPI00254E2814|nr:hypothetical protein [Arthrobacter sp. efr-133-TYG-118]